MRSTAITLAALAASLSIASGVDAQAMSGPVPRLRPSSASRGKGGKRAHRSVGTKAYQRKALKARNVRRNRARATGSAA